MNNININYTESFYDSVKSSSEPSAEIVVPLIIDLVRPKTVVDVGCGSGAWLRRFKQLGCQIQGLDGPWVNVDQLVISKEEFQIINFESTFKLKTSYDLAICLEVAEHLSENSADKFMESLCVLAPVICFSAAIPGQGGTNHLNEQWQSYWIEKFNSMGFECYDCLRPTIWYNVNIAVHYRQNIFIFVKKSQDEITIPEHQHIRNSISDLVHPSVLADKTGPQNNSFKKFFLGFLPHYFKAIFK